MSVPCCFSLRRYVSHSCSSVRSSTLLTLKGINAYAYMTAGRMIWTFHPEKRIWKVKAMSIGKYFVWLDIASFIIQGIGGSMLSPGNSQTTQKLGKSIYMAGVGIQEGFIILFTLLIIRFHIEMFRMERQGLASKSPRWKWLTYALYSCLALITVCFSQLSVSVNVSLIPVTDAYLLPID